MKSLHCVFLLTIMIGLGAAASAQEDPVYAAGGRVFPMLSRVLTADQRQSVLQILAVDRVQIRSLEEKIRASRLAMVNQSAAGNFDENLVRQYARQSAAAEVELSVIFARALSKMQPPLSAQQLAQVKNFAPGHFRDARRAEDPPPAPEVHLKLPPTLPTDTNGLPVVN